MSPPNSSSCFLRLSTSLVMIVVVLVGTLLSSGMVTIGNEISFHNKRTRRIKEEKRRKGNVHDWSNLLAPHQISYWKLGGLRNDTFVSESAARFLSNDNNNNNNNSDDPVSSPSSSSSSNTNNSNEYGGGLVPEDNADEIDCEKFQHLDELPPFCQQQDNDNNDNENENGSPVQGQGGEEKEEEEEDESFLDDNMNTLFPSQGTPPPPPTYTDDDIFESQTIFVDNSIQVPVSVGIYHLDTITEKRARILITLIVETMSIMLDRYTPFHVIAPDDDNDDDDDDDDEESKDNDDDRLRHLQTENGNGNRRNGGEGSGSGNQSGGRPPELLARLFFNTVSVWESPRIDSWWQLSADYVVFWPNDDPVSNERKLEQIQTACRQVLNMTVDAKKFWEELLHDDEEEQYVARKGQLRKQTKKDNAAIAAVARYGEEYPLIELSYEGDVGDANISASRSDNRSQSYSEPLVLEWTVREWFGLGLCTLTLLFTGTLFLVSSYLHHQQATNALWWLTEHGVGELLQVGWAYHQQEGNGQLFLQVYNKDKIGYNDENSMLQGAPAPPPPSPIPEGQGSGTGSSSTTTPSPPPAAAAAAAAAS